MRRLIRTAKMLARARRQARFPFRSPETVAEARRRRVRAIVRHAYESTPFWRRAIDRLGERPEDFADADDLRRLPEIRASDLQGRPRAFASRAVRPDDVVTVMSGGSTAEPKAVLHDARAVLANAVHGERERSIVARRVGRPTGYRELVVTPPFSSAEATQSLVRERTLLPGTLSVRRRYLSLLDDLDANVRETRSFRPHVIHTYGSYLAPLLERLAETGGIPRELKVATFSSDPMPAADRERVEEDLGIPVLATYQAVEAFKIGFECGEGEGYHVNHDLYPVRIVDEAGLDLPPGEAGSVVVSNLVNRATVLLNYRIGDRAATIPEPCPCGRSLPRVTPPIGREDDWVELADGRRTHPQAVATLFTDEKEIRGYQVVQIAPGQFRVRLVAATGIDRDRAAGRVRERFRERFGEVEVETEWVERLERTEAGKRRVVVRR